MPQSRAFFSTSTDAMWAVCPGHHRRIGNSAYWWGRQQHNVKPGRRRLSMQANQRWPSCTGKVVILASLGHRHIISWCESCSTKDDDRQRSSVAMLCWPWKTTSQRHNPHKRLHERRFIPRVRTPCGRCAQVIIEG